MSGANYFWCPVCDSKALYDHTDEPSEVEGLTVMHDACLESLKRDTAAQALTQAANDWTDGVHTLQGTNAALWLRDRAAALRSTEEPTDV